MSVLEELAERQAGNQQPFVIYGDKTYHFNDMIHASFSNIDQIQNGDVVALIGDFNPAGINTLLHLIDRRAIIVPLTHETRARHAYFFEAAGVDIVIDNGQISRIRVKKYSHPMLDDMRRSNHAGLVLFSSGTTGQPKAILHNFDNFLIRYRTPREAFRTMSFLLFDHIGGINTLLHTLYNRGTIIVPSKRTPAAVLDDVVRHRIDVLPATPTFLRMLLLSGMLDQNALPNLRLITYGAERMDELTLKRLCTLLPNVDFRQTYGMSELGILRIKSRARDNLWIKVGGEGIEIRVIDDVLHIRASHRMAGYINAPSPFDQEGWYDTKDIVEQDGEWIRIVGRANDVVNVGGLKVLPAEIEHIAQTHPAVAFAKAEGKPNPITGEHIELTVEPRDGMTLDRKKMRIFLQENMPEALIPHRIVIDKIPYNHRFKRI